MTHGLILANEQFASLRAEMHEKLEPPRQRFPVIFSLRFPDAGNSCKIVLSSPLMPIRRPPHARPQHFALSR